MGAERLLLLPALYTIAIWALYFNTAAFLAVVPPLPFIGSSKTLNEILPLHPSGIYQAFLYGQWNGRVAVYEQLAKSDPAYKSEIDIILKEGM